MPHILMAKKLVIDGLRNGLGVEQAGNRMAGIKVGPGVGRRIRLGVGLGSIRESERESDSAYDACKQDQRCSGKRLTVAVARRFDIDAMDIMLVVIYEAEH